MHTTSWRRLLLVPVILTSLLAFAPAALAQDAPAQDPSQGQVVESWTLTPAGSDGSGQPGNRSDLSYTVPPGQTVQDSVTVYNYSNVPLPFHVYAADGFNNEDGGFDVLAGDQTSTDVGSWVKFDLDQLTLQPGTQATIPITITVPADASPGDHVGAILASSRAEGTSADGKVVALDRRTGTRLYVRVDGPIEPQLAVENVSPKYDPSLNPLGGTGTVSYTVVNRGNVRLGGTTHISVGGIFGLFAKSSPTVDLPELLPGQSYRATATVSGVPAFVVDRATVHVDPTPVQGDDATAKAQSKSSLVLALPYTLLALAIVAGLVWFAIRRYRRHLGDSSGPTNRPEVGPGGGPQQSARPLESQSV